MLELAAIEQTGQCIVTGLEGELGGGLFDSRLHGEVNFLDARGHFIEAVFENAKLAA